MSVFLALIFQVLFVFFAMVINIGLLVHDKINLQNAVDLGAYYAAQKQAEILNEIAHLNYQIRQDYKLLAWRYWVLGTMGRSGNPAQPAIVPPQASAPATILPDSPRLYGPVGEEVPIACLANLRWWEFAFIASQAGLPNENYCWQPNNWQSGSIQNPSVPFTPATAGVNAAASQSAQMSQTAFTASCQEASPLSWAYVATILTHYKISIGHRKRAIKALRENLVRENPVDREGNSIRDGVIATIRKNLTESNRESFDPASVQLMNGLAVGSECGGGAMPGENTLPEILTSPGLYFAFLRGAGTSCSFSYAFQTQHQEISAAGGNVARWDPDGRLRGMVSGEPDPTNPYAHEHSSLGFEKNPWCMAYVGVKAQTQPRKPFAPFGRATTLVARAFAQPFGGRIGPWYSKRWTRGNMKSDPVAQPVATVGAVVQLNPVEGSIQTEMRTDPLTSPRVGDGSNTSSGYVYSSYSIPNYSRFPGDRLGLRSQRAQSLARHVLGQIMMTVPASLGNTADGRIRLNWFYGFGDQLVTGDPLVYDVVQQNNPTLMRYRRLELAAVAPDLFDITYYSVDPEAYRNYMIHTENNKARYGLIANENVYGDLGSRAVGAGYARTDNNVTAQIQAANADGIEPNARGAAFWIVQNWTHLLTAWAPHRITSFIFPIERFGRCPTGAEAYNSVMIPGKCVAGGRVGYSVRLISRDHLNGNWDLGGEGAGAGPLLNPPRLNSDF
ncbi:MAG: Tad domain-containing protein [Bdellovibrionales bacterium]|jgi:hypothetical protein|nr:Tad domain-containing protein [Bdellovibrionales bacterium]